MKKIATFLKLTAQGGLLVLLPILLFVFLLMEMVELVVGLATPIADLFPAGTFGDPDHPVALAVILTAGASLLIGMAMKSSGAKRLGNWMEEKTVGKLTIYRFLKSLSSGLMGAEKTANFKPALFDAGSGGRKIVYAIEELGNGECAALFPSPPSGFAGPVKIVSVERITLLEASLGEVSMVLNHMGLGVGKILKKTED